MTVQKHRTTEDLHIEVVRTPGLGDSSYLVAYEGVGLLVDPQRDVDRFLHRLSDLDVELRWVLETHLHNDYVSGGVVAARRTGAELVVPAAAAPAYRHTPAFHLEEIGDRRLTIRPIHTPGHTPEHTSYLVLIEGTPVALFSGGSLLVGSAGRPDLLGKERAESLARLQYRSVRRLAELPDGVRLYPTHGEGSFCTAGAAGVHTSTIGEEKRTNPVLAYPDEDAFVQGQLAGLQPYPAYYRHMGPANLVGGRPMPPLEVPTLDPETVAGMVRTAAIVDVRDRHRFAAGHIPGSLGIELRDDFGIWVGWLIDIDRPIVLVADPSQDLAEAVTQLARIGYDRVEGVLYGLGGWENAGFGLARYRTATLTEFAEAAARGEPILDVRSPAEYDEGHLQDAVHRYLPDLETADLSVFGEGDRVWVACATGYRATIAAGILERRGFLPVVLTDGGVPDLCGPGSDPRFQHLCARGSGDR